MRDYRTWLGGLPANVAQRVAWGNAAALLGVSVVSPDRKN